MSRFFIEETRIGFFEAQWEDEHFVETKVKNEAGTEFYLTCGMLSGCYDFWKNDHSIIASLSAEDRDVDSDVLNKSHVGGGEVNWDLYKLKDNEYWPVFKVLIYIMAYKFDEFETVDLNGMWTDEVEIPEMEEVEAPEKD